MKRTAATLLFLTLAASAGLANDRAPNSEERSRIEASLRQAGFTAWGSIERDDSRWEVDDAVAADGRRYDLDLEISSLAIVARDRDDDDDD